MSISELVDAIRKAVIAWIRAGGREADLGYSVYHRGANFVVAIGSPPRKKTVLVQSRTESRALSDAQKIEIRHLIEFLMDRFGLHKRTQNDHGVQIITSFSRASA